MKANTNVLVRRQNLPARVGLFSIGLAAYWEQFPGMKEALEKFTMNLTSQLEAWGTEVHSAGMVDTPEAGRSAGDFFAERNVDIIFCHVATYCTSQCVLPAVQRRKVPVVVLGLQPAATFDYPNVDTEEWLTGDAYCCIPEISGVFQRAGIEFNVVLGQLYDDTRTQNELKGWVTAASISRTLYYARLGSLGHTYPGMMDMYSDFTMHAAQLGSHVEVLEMCDLKERVDQISDEAAASVVSMTREMFDLTDIHSRDRLVSPPTEEQLLWGGRVAKGLELLFTDFNLTALAYYYRGVNNNEYERLAAGIILGNTYLTSNGFPCATEGDLKTSVAMLILDSLGAGGSFCEVALLDYVEDFVMLGHDGPGHIGITGHKPILRGLELYHGKRGSGLSVEFNVKNGPITVLGMTQTAAGRLKWVVSEGESVPGEILKLGNCNTRTVFSLKPAEWLAAWCHEGPTHHCALGLGHHVETIRKLAKIMNIELAVVG